MSDPLSAATSTIADGYVTGFYAALNRPVTTGEHHEIESLADHVTMVDMTTDTDESDTTMAVDGEYIGTKSGGTTFPVPFTHPFELDAYTRQKAEAEFDKPLDDRSVDPAVIDRNEDESATIDH